MFNIQYSAPHVHLNIERPLIEYRTANTLFLIQFSTANSLKFHRKFKIKFNPEN